MKADLRLFGFATGVWAASLAALHVTTHSAVVAAVFAGLAGAAVWPRRGERPWRGAVVGVLLGVVCGCLSTGARTLARDAEPLASLARTHSMARVELTVTHDPYPLHGGRPGPPTYLVRGRLERLSTAATGDIVLSARIIVFGSDEAWRDLLPSQRVGAFGRLAPARRGDLTAAVLNVTGAPQRLSRPSWTQLAAGRLRAGLQAACAPLPAEPGGLLPGLVIGDTSRLDPAVAEDFRATGLTHLVAVSGSNVALVLTVVLFVARWCRAGPWLAAGTGAVALVGFVILVRPEPSVVRAAAMGAVGLLALATGRARSAAPALAAAVVFGLLIDPGLAVDPGFALSVLATGAIVLLAPRWRDALRTRGVPPVIAEALAVPAAAQLACAPLIAALSGSVSLAAVPANLLAVPAVAPATLLGVAATLIYPLWSDGGEFLAWCASWPARWLVAVARVGAGVPAAEVAWPSGFVGGLALAVLAVALLVAGRWPAARRLVFAVALAIAVGALPVRLLASGWPPRDAVIVACDVGQGDALVLPAGPGQAVVVDAGPDPVPVDRCLRRLGVDGVLLLVFTHFHADHVGGVAGVMRGRNVGGVVVPPFGEPTEGWRLVRDAVRGTPVIEARPGWTFARGWLHLRVIGPVRPLAGTRSDPNNNSVIVYAESRGVTMVLAGDAEAEQQRDLAGVITSHADVLKVAHHGSSFQDAGFLDAVDPRVALVSVGADNPYGHPSPWVLDRLADSGARVMRTDQHGDVAVVVTDGSLAVVARGAASAHR